MRKRNQLYKKYILDRTIERYDAFKKVRNMHPPLIINVYINDVTHYKHLGIFLSNDFEHINNITSKA